LGEDFIPEGTNALTYLQTIETSEPGFLFIGKDGKVVFRQRNAANSISNVVFADDGTGIGYTDLQVTYGSELLYNEINVTSAITSTTVTSTDATSQSDYGILSLNQDGLLINSDADLTSYGQYLIGQYAQPEYRFEGITVELTKLSESQQDQLLALEIANVVKVIFTPNGIAPAIEQYGQIVKIDHQVSVDKHTVTFGLATVENVGFTLDSPAFGRLDVNRLAW